MDDITEVVLNFLSESANIPLEQVTFDRSFEDYEIDSIMFVRLIIKMESIFHMNFADDRLTMDSFSGIPEFIEYIRVLVKAGEGV